MMHEGMHGFGIVWMLVMAVIMVVPFWKLCLRAGYPGVMGLLILVPVVNLIFLYFLAFSRWPTEQGGSGEQP